MQKLLLIPFIAALLALAACSDPTAAPTANIPATAPTTETSTSTASAAPTMAQAPTATTQPYSEPEPTTTAQPGSTWRGLAIATENRCSPYDSEDYRYVQSVEARIVNAQGGIYGPYTGTWFKSTRETDIEHILARSEAHDSGLCTATKSTRSQFASDLLNLTLASPSVNRHQKVAKTSPSGCQPSTSAGTSTGPYGSA